MRKAVLEDVLAMLKEHRLVDNESEFSRDWLGRSESYLRVQRFHKEAPSISCIAICASKLQHYGQRLAENGGQDELAERFIQLSEECHRHINAESETIWLCADRMGHTAKKAERAI